MHVVITGASSGIGAALARAYFARGAAVTLVARRKDLLDALAAESQHPVHVVQADLTRSEEVLSWVSGAQEKLGPIDVLINNAGVQIVKAFHQTPWEDAQRMLELDLLSPLRLSQHVVTGMISRGRGTLVDISSMAGIAPTPGMAFYNAAKAGLGGASESLRAELKPHGVHVVTVYPGPVSTPLEQAGRAAYEPSLAARILAPTGKAEVLAALVIRAVERKRARVIYPRMMVLARHFPAITRWVLDHFTPPLITH